ncbi:MAG: helix-turn-helix domain-containing protein [Candidatus Niyogibacteria bacterium]|nr:helix-turn-helix domain-containing protein [Candidatus Niyogibacteria bacterium]
MVPELKTVLKSIGLNDKEITVYDALLPLGQATVRDLSSRTGINRGTVHDILEILLERGLLQSERQGSRRRFLLASPERIVSVLEDKKRDIHDQKTKFEEIIPQLKSLYAKQGGRPRVEYFDSDEGIKKILDDVLATCELLGDKKEYVLYSSTSVRNYLYKLFPHFTKEKTKRKIYTKVIGLGGEGDPKHLMMAERKTIKEDAPAYMIVYGPKIALISVAEDDIPFGVLIQDEKIASTQRMLFDQLWGKLM